MTEKEAIEKLKDIIASLEDDEEVCHMKADKLLCDVLSSLGYSELVKLFHTIHKWYS